MLSSVKAKMLALASVAVLALLVIAINSTLGMSRLAELQNIAHDRAADSTQAEKAAAMGAALYQVIADTIINRDFGASTTKWSETKATTSRHLELAEKAADTPAERDAAARARVAFEKLAGLYEQNLLPLLKNGAGVDDRIRNLDGEIDALVTAMQTDLTAIATAMGKEAEQADLEFDGARSATIRTNLILSLATLIVLVGMMAKQTRDLLRQLGAEPSHTVRIAERIAAGDLSCAVELKPGDETSLLASMRKMQSALATMLQQIQVVCTSVDSSAAHLAGSAHEISKGSQLQSDSAIMSLMHMT